MAMPLLCIPFAYLLLPDVRLSDPIGDDIKKELLEDEQEAAWDASFSASSEDEKAENG